jgi:hypothetical protein
MRPPDLIRGMVGGAAPAYGSVGPCREEKNMSRGPSVPRSGCALDMFFSSQSMGRGRKAANCRFAAFPSRFLKADLRLRVRGLNEIALHTA